MGRSRSTRTNRAPIRRRRIIWPAPMWAAEMGRARSTSPQADAQIGGHVAADRRVRVARDLAGKLASRRGDDRDCRSCEALGLGGHEERDLAHGEYAERGLGGRREI